MSEFITQAKHNEAFHDCICRDYETLFFDWKVTVTFYIAIHYLKALASQRKIHIGSTHEEIAGNIDPNFRKNKPSMPISENAWGWYRNLYQYSRTSRYTGYTDEKTFSLLMESDHKNCIANLNKFKKYIKGQGVKLDD